MVILNKTDYIKKEFYSWKWEQIFDSWSPTSTKNDNTLKIKSQLQRLLQLNKEDVLPKNLYELIWPTDSQQPRMYGLPKKHKKDVPLRPILSTTGSAQHQLAKYLSSLLEPVLALYTSNCTWDSFIFNDIIKNVGRARRRQLFQRALSILYVQSLPQTLLSDTAKELSTSTKPEYWVVA